MSIVGVNLNRISKRWRIPVTAGERSFSRTSSSGIPDQSLSRHLPPVKLAKMIAVAFVVVAGMLAFDLPILWITSGKFLARFPF